MGKAMRHVHFVLGVDIHTIRRCPSQEGRIALTFATLQLCFQPRAELKKTQYQVVVGFLRTKDILKPQRIDSEWLRIYF